MRQGIVWNVSVAGLYVAIEHPIPRAGDLLRVSFALPGDPQPIQADLRVVWCNPRSLLRGTGLRALKFPPGCGLEFVAVTPGDLERIRNRVEATYPR